MRNLQEYPITTEEIIECLQKYKEDALSEQRVGDMRPLLLTAAIRALSLAELAEIDGDLI